ncbi:MAG TPA: metallopeptidase family protein [Dehalococcoidia bacterium]|nr:metallopeptidase family protein [Dehalococcoidia bacterium]
MNDDEDIATKRMFDLIDRAFEQLPRQYASALENVDIGVERTVTTQDRRRLRIGNATLYGLYEGVPLTQRGAYYDRVLPDRITLYWGPLMRDFPDDGRLADQVRKTLFHEIAHYFGMSEGDLHGTSVR